MGKLTWLDTLLKAKPHDFQLISAGERKNEDEGQDQDGQPGLFLIKIVKYLSYL